MEIFTITTKILMKEPISTKELEFFRTYNEKYALVCEMVMKELGRDVSKTTTKFHFTPGDDFIDTAIEEVVNEILGTLKSVQS